MPVCKYRHQCDIAPPQPDHHAASANTNGRGQTVLCRNQWHAVQQRLKMSAHEMRIVRYMVDDVTESAIAERMALSPHTLHSQVLRIYAKARVTSRVQLVVRVFGSLVLHCPRAQNHAPQRSSTD